VAKFSLTAVPKLTYKQKYLFNGVRVDCSNKKAHLKKVGLLVAVLLIKF
jgi:hypothetical protein